MRDFLHFELFTVGKQSQFIQTQNTGGKTPDMELNPASSNFAETKNQKHPPSHKASANKNPIHSDIQNKEG